MMKAWILALTLTATPAAAERYLWVSSNQTTGFLTTIDVDSIRLVDGHPRAWVTVMLANEETSPNHQPVYITSLTEFDCKLERSQILASRVFRENGVMLKNLEPEGWRYDMPETVSYETLKYGCGKAPDDDQITQGPLSDIFKTYLGEYRKRAGGR